jgi:hypothetical protein
MVNRSSLSVVYHLYQYGRWQQLFYEQIGALYSSGLIDAAQVTISVNGSEQLPGLSDCVKVFHDDNNGEMRALLLAHEYARAGDHAILYLHSKGISHPTPNQDDWRMMMQHYLIANWRMAIDYLDDYDVSTVNWRTHPCPHPSGNFWWARTDYLRTLDADYLSTTDRMTHEFWLGTKNPKVANLNETEIDHYNSPCPPSKYTQDYFALRGRETHSLSHSSRREAIENGLLTPVFNVDYF